MKQRVRAMEAFLDDAYGNQHCVRDGILPAGLISSSLYFYRQAAGIRSATAVRIQVSGIDLIRDEHGEMRVLEDNVRVPSGVSYVISNRRVMAQTLPELFVSMRVRPSATTRTSCSPPCGPRPAGIDDPNIVVLTPGVYKLAYFEHTLLARLMGRLELSRGATCCAWAARSSCAPRADRSASTSSTAASTTTSSTRCIPRRLDARRHGTHARRAPGQRHDRHTPWATASPTTSCSTRTSRPDRYYLAEEPILKNVDTGGSKTGGALEEVLDRLPELVVKPVDGSGGKGLVVGPTPRPRSSTPSAAPSRRPARWIAQPVVMLSTIPTSSKTGCARGTPTCVLRGQRRRRHLGAPEV